MRKRNPGAKCAERNRPQDLSSQDGDDYLASTITGSAELLLKGRQHLHSGVAQTMSEIYMDDEKEVEEREKGKEKGGKTHKKTDSNTERQK